MYTGPGIEIRAPDRHCRAGFSVLFAISWIGRLLRGALWTAGAVGAVAGAVASRLSPLTDRAQWLLQATTTDLRLRWAAAKRVWNEARMIDGYAGISAEGDPATPQLFGALVREGDGVRLRRQVPANRPAFQRWYADPEIARLLRHDQEPLTNVQSKGYFDTIILPLSARGMCFAIHEVETEEVIGMSALTDIDANAGSALFRIVIGEKDRWGRGYGTEATRLVVREAFERLGLREVRLEVFRHNPRARSAYARVGFEVTGEHVEWVQRLNVQLNVLEMRLLREEFYRREQSGTDQSGMSPAE
jgi:RimJ/RimL family protein N-acetyltransferase